MNKDHPHAGGGHVAFVASDTLVAALDQTAAEQGVTRSHLARALIADALRQAGALDSGAPLTRHQARRTRA